MAGKQRLLVTILSLGRPANVLRQLADLPNWLQELSGQTGIASHIVIRNNDPGCPFTEVADRVAAVNNQFADVTCTLITGVPNNGFGAGHNTNIASAPSDFVLILNDDIGFPHMAWLGEALRMLQNDAAMAAVAAEENPRYINPLFGNGLLPGSFHLHGLTYGEASILLCRRSALEEAGGFHDDFAWAMCEDADLSLRLQQLGYSIGTISMPHQHWRSTSFNSLPGAVKSSIMEHNRAALFANWRDSMATGRVGHYEVFDLWSDGMGDVLCALPHLIARIGPMSAAQRAQVIVNTSHPELLSWFSLRGITIRSEPDLMKLRSALLAEGVATLRSIREVNFSLPFNIHVLLAGGLGVRPADPAVRAQMAARLARLRPPSSLPPMHGRTVVVHLEFERDHEGRALPPLMMARVLTLCGQLFDTVVLVGRERRLSESLCELPTATFIDLQGKLSVTQLAAVVASASFFVGIDSFPSHLAQAAGVPAAIFFGAVHPLTRVWQAERVWPLMAPLDCIGCYHAHLEASVPFCMRRDQACTTEITADALRTVLQNMMRGVAYDWAAAAHSLQTWQARLIKLEKFHPAPPERVFKGQAVPNERFSNLIYQMADRMGDLLRGQYQTSTVSMLMEKVQVLQSQVFAGRVQLEEVQRQKPGEPGSSVAIRDDNATTRILQLTRVAVEAVRCHMEIVDQWIEVDSFDEDPQILLPVICGSGGKVQLRLSCAAEPHEALQIYWAFGDEAFSVENLRTVAASSSLVSANLVLDVPEGALLRIRIDPITGVGRSRLHGSLGGLFTLEEAERAPLVKPPVTDEPAGEAVQAPTADEAEAACEAETAIAVEAAALAQVAQAAPTGTAAMKHAARAARRAAAH